MEVRIGARSEEDWRRLGAVLAPFYDLAVRTEHWDAAARIHYDLRRSGLSIPPPDALIAAVAISHGVTLVHRDRHFDLVAVHEPLEVESYVDPAADPPA